MTRGAWRLIGFMLLFTISGCGFLPRIVFLHDPLTSQEHLELGTRYEIQGEWDFAEKEYRAALDQDSRFLPALTGLGNLSAQRGDGRSAEGYYRRALKLDPDHPMANNNLASVLIEQGRHLEEARERIDRALAADPAHRAFFMDTRALLLLRMGRTDEALEAAEEAEASPGADLPGFADQHAVTRARIDALKASPVSNRSGHP